MATTDRARALDGADYVITIQVAGYRPGTVLDFAFPAKYGLRQTIADTLGIGGIMRAVRTVPVLLDIAADMEQLCPNAVHINYANPMAMNCWGLTAARTASRWPTWSRSNRKSAGDGGEGSRRTTVIRCARSAGFSQIQPHRTACPTLRAHRHGQTDKHCQLRIRHFQPRATTAGEGTARGFGPTSIFIAFAAGFS